MHLDRGSKSGPSGQVHPEQCPLKGEPIVGRCVHPERGGVPDHMLGEGHYANRCLDHERMVIVPEAFFASAVSKRVSLSMI